MSREIHLYIHIHVWSNPWTLLALSLSTASTTGRHLKHTMHMSGASEEGDKTRSGGRQLGVLSPNRGSCNCCCGNVFVGTWQSFKPKSFRSMPAYVFMLVFSTLQSKCRYHHNAILTSSPRHIHTHTRRYRVALHAKNGVFAHKFDICTNVFSAGSCKKCTNIVSTTGTAKYNSYASWAWQRRSFTRVHKNALNLYWHSQVRSRQRVLGLKVKLFINNVVN